MPREPKAANAAAQPTCEASEITYKASEIAANAQRLFGYSPDLARAAFAYNKVDRCTLEKARQLIRNFAERKVK